MNLSGLISRYKAAAHLLLTLLFVTSCSMQQRSSSLQQSSPNRQVGNIEKQQSFFVRESNPKLPEAMPSELLPRPSIPSAQAQAIEKKLGIAIQENDPDMPLYIEAAKWVGVRYKYSGMGENGIDCSGLTYRLYKAVYEKTLHRSSAEMARYDVKEIDKSMLKPGDLIFFATFGNKKTITHVGVYLKDNRFIHASSKVGVVVNNLNEEYYRKTFVKCGKVE